MNILVTGGAGYIGSVLVDHLISADHQVTILDNFMYGQTSLNHLCYDPALTIVKGDCRDGNLIQSLVKKTDIVIPLAAIVGAPACSLDETAAKSIICDSLWILAQSMSSDQRIIYATTNSGYGIGEKGIECTEETPLRPVSLYGRLKTEAEAHIMSGKNNTSLRLATVFGMSPRMRLDLLVNDFVYRAVKDRFVVLFEPHFKRNYIHVRDVAQAFIHTINNFDTMKGQVYNVGLSSANLSKLELCEAIQQHIPEFHFPIDDIGKDPDKRDYIVSNAKIEATGWYPLWNLHSGIAELIRGYQQFGKGQYTNA